LNDANSLLTLAGILTIGDVDGTAASNSGKGIQVSSSATLGDYDLSAVSYLDIAANKTLAGQLNLQTNGELKTSGDGQYIGDIALAGGKFSATDNQVLGGTLSITADSELSVSQYHTLTLSQTGGLALGANTLTISGGGSLVSGGLTLDNASSKLVLNSITVDNVSTTSDSLGLDVDADSTVTSLTVGHTTPVSIVSGRTLSGAITVTAGSIKLDEAGTLASTVSMSGGTLDADNSSTLSGTLTQAGSITIDVKSGEVLTYSGAALSLGANTLTLSGGGTLGNTNAIKLDNADSKLLLNSITVDSVSTTIDNSLGLDVDNNSTITALSVGHITPVSIAAGKTLSGAITVTAGSIKLDETGTLASTIAMSSGTLDADESLTLSGTLTQSGAITIDVADNKTLTYSGTALSLGANTLTLSGGGTLSNTNAFVLNHASSKLLLNSIIVDNVSTSANSLGLDVDNNSTITALSVGYITPVSIAGSKILSGAITVTAGSIKLDETGELASTISMSGGVLDADNSSTLSGTLTQSGAITIDVADGKTLTYSGASLSLVANTMTLSGEGTFSNSNALVLNHASSKLLLSSSITVDNVSTSSNSLGLDVDDDSTVSSLTVAHTTPVSIASSKTLSGAITITDGSIRLGETGTLASSVSMSGGELDADNSLTLSGALTQSGDIEIDVAEDKTLSYSGASLSLDNNTLTLSGEGRLSNTKALVLNHASSKLLLDSITVDNVSTSANNSGLDVNDDSTVTSLTVAYTTPVSIASTKTLSGAITVTAGSLQLDETGTLASTVSMSGGTLDADNSLTLSGALTQAGNITIDVADNKTLSYSGASLSLGAYTLTMSGGGRFSNSNALELNNASSKLLLSSITVDNVSTSLASLGLDVDD